MVSSIFKIAQLVVGCITGKVAGDKGIRMTVPLHGDRERLLKLIENISPLERKFLAIDRKMDNIRRNLRDQRHLYLLKDRDDVIGFIRETGRGSRGAQIEEIYIRPDYRGAGHAKKLINHLLDKFDYLTAKTLNKNKKMAKVLKSLDGEIVRRTPGGEILYWEISK